MTLDLWTCRWPEGSKGLTVDSKIDTASSGVAALVAARDFLQGRGSNRLFPTNVVVGGRHGVLIHDPAHAQGVFIPRMSLTEDTTDSFPTMAQA